MARPDQQPAGPGGVADANPDGGLGRETLPRGAIADELHADEQAQPPDVADPGVALPEAAQAGPQALAPADRVGRDLIAPELAHRGETDRAGHRVRPVRVAAVELDEVARLAPERVGDPAVEDDRGQGRVAAAQALAQAHDVRPCVEELRGEHGAQAPERRDDLVEDQQDPVAIAQLPQARQVARRRDHDPGRHEDRLGDQGRDGPGILELDRLLDETQVGRRDGLGRDVERRAVGVRRVEVDEAAGQGLVRRPPDGPAAGRDRVAGCAVVGAVVGQDLVLRRVPSLLVELAGDLHRRFGGLAAPGEQLDHRVAVGQEAQEDIDELEGPVVRGHRRGGHGEPPQLRRPGLRELRVAMAKRRAEGAREPVDVAPPLDVDHVDPGAFGEHEGVVAERLHLHEVDHRVANLVVHRHLLLRFGRPCGTVTARRCAPSAPRRPPPASH